MKGGELTIEALKPVFLIGVVDGEAALLRPPVLILNDLTRNQAR